MCPEMGQVHTKRFVLLKCRCGYNVFNMSTLLIRKASSLDAAGIVAVLELRRSPRLTHPCFREMTQRWRPAAFSR
jgi:hypothetical protein